MSEKLSHSDLANLFDNFDIVCNNDNVDRTSEEYKKYAKYFEDFKNENKEIFDRIEKSNDQNELIIGAVELIKFLDKEYYCGGKYNFLNVSEYRKIMLFTNHANDKKRTNEITIDELFAPKVAWDFVEYMVNEYKNNEGKDNIWSELKNDQSSGQTLARTMSSALIQSIPDDKLKFVIIHVGKDKCIKTESALYKGELFYFIKRLSEYNKKKNEDLNALITRLKQFESKEEKTEYDTKKITKIKDNIEEVKNEIEKNKQILKRKFHFLSTDATEEKISCKHTKIFKHLS